MGQVVIARAIGGLLRGSVEALSRQAKGGFLILAYQKSSAPFSLTTQLLAYGTIPSTNTAFRSWVRVWWVGDDFWYSSMRNPPTTPSPSELSEPSELSNNPSTLFPQKPKDEKESSPSPFGNRPYRRHRLTHQFQTRRPQLPHGRRRH